VVLTVENMNITVFWNLMPYSLLDCYLPTKLQRHMLEDSNLWFHRYYHECHRFFLRERGQPENENLLIDLCFKSFKNISTDRPRVVDLYIKTDGTTLKNNCNFWIYLVISLLFLQMSSLSPPNQCLWTLNRHEVTFIIIMSLIPVL
jgi:hypothetical protein